MYCQRCGAENTEDAVYCSTCGSKIPGKGMKQPGGWYTPSALDIELEKKPRQPVVSGGQAGHPGTQAPVNPFIRPERDKMGRSIPREYPPSFNRSGWNWPGFLFPALWCCYKGIYNAAWKYILISFIACPIAQIWCGIVGYNEYATFIDSNPPQSIGKSKSTGIGCFWWLIIVNVIGGVISIVLLMIFWSFFQSLITGNDINELNKLMNMGI
jgi:hypothetical protein